MFQFRFSPRAKAAALLGLFAALYGLISFPNHYLLRTYALDLGLYTHALWHYAHLSVHDSSLFMERSQSILADHFDLYLPLLSPLVYVLGSWTLLVVQWIALLLGAWGIRRLLLTMGLSVNSALLGMAMYLLFFEVFAAVAFDYHSNVVATSVLPWFLVALWRSRKVLAVLLFLLMLMGKENLGLWLGPVALLLAFESSLDARMRRLCAALGIFGLAWSFVVIGIIMPALTVNEEYAHFDYSILGGSLRNVGSAVLEHPLRILKTFFLDDTGATNGTAIKIEFWWMMLVAGGWAFFLNPRWGLMAVPLLAQKMLHDDPGKWSVVAHYGVEFAPLIAVAVPLSLARLKEGRFRQCLTVLVVICSFGCTIRFMDRTVAYQDRSRIRFYQPEHYTKPYSVAAFYRVVDNIPVEAVVSAQSPAVPHLALRDAVYQFPILNEAEHLVLLPIESPYPLDTAHYRVQLSELLANREWQLMDSTGGVFHFRRRNQ